MKFIDFFKKYKKPIKDNAETVIINENRIKGGLALGSGGTRGFAHLGVLKAFEDENIRFDYVAGTSAGSIVGALYSFGYSVTEMIDFASKLSIKDVKSSSLIFMPSSAQPIEDVVRKFLGDVSFSDSKIPFACVSVDLVSAKEIVMKQGDLPKAISASCAVPPFYRPVVWGEMHLIDGAFANPIPAKVVRDMGADIVVSVEVNSTRGIGTDSLSIVDVYLASTRIATRFTADEGVRNSDVMLKPDLKDFTSHNMKGVNEMIKNGYDEAYRQMEKIKELLGLPNPHKANPKGAPILEFMSSKK